MKKVCFLAAFIISTFCAQSQVSREKISQAFSALENDDQLKSGLVSLYIIDARADSVLFEKNAFTGMAGASTQKIITSATAYEVLGSDFHFTTSFGYLKMDKKRSLYVRGSGDPTLGSWRWPQTAEKYILNNILDSFKRYHSTSFHSVIIDETGWESEVVPDGWIWQDLGNYYGAVANNLNWRENQYDLVLRSGKNIGDSARIVTVRPYLYFNTIRSYVTAAQKGTGDNTYIYLPFNAPEISIKGTIPVEENEFIVSGSMPSGARQLGGTLVDALSGKSNVKTPVEIWDKVPKGFDTNKVQILYKEYSPDMDSMMYWFLKKSINLYGEAFLKTIAYHDSKLASTENGVTFLRDFWAQKGIDKRELNIVDGSGLSPENRVTTHAQVSILKYAMKQPWFKGYYNAFPVYNGMKMKSGTISGVKGFCGYHTSSDGHQYIFSLLINNYNGSTSALVQKMYKLLDVLK